MTVIGSICVMTTMPVVSDVWTMLPGSTWRRPTRPDTGAVMRVYDSCTRALSALPWSSLTVPSYWRTSEACVSTCCLAMESCAIRVW